MKKIMLIFIIVTLTGCQSKITWQSEPNSPLFTLTGSAANTMAGALAQNALTAQGRVSEVMKYTGWLYVFLVIMFVSGCAFWGLTRSRYGFVIPASAIGGIVFITFWAEYSHWISLGVLVIGLGVLIWKAIEYQKERNVLIERTKNDKEK